MISHRSIQSHGKEFSKISFLSTSVIKCMYTCMSNCFFRLFFFASASKSISFRLRKYISSALCFYCSAFNSCHGIYLAFEPRLRNRALALLVIVTSWVLCFLRPSRPVFRALKWFWPVLRARILPFFVTLSLLLYDLFVFIFLFYFFFEFFLLGLRFRCVSFNSTR